MEPLGLRLGEIINVVISSYIENISKELLRLMKDRPSITQEEILRFSKDKLVDHLLQERNSSDIVKAVATDMWDSFVSEKINEFAGIIKATITGGTNAADTVRRV